MNKDELPRQARDEHKEQDALPRQVQEDTDLKKKRKLELLQVELQPTLKLRMLDQ